MISDRYDPESLSPAELDVYLEKGWYRIGSSLITKQYVDFDGTVRSVVWTRLDIRGYRFRPSLRKLMARNARRFDVAVGPLVLDDERETLYERYRVHVGGQRAPSLELLLGGARGRRLFDTREIRILDGTRLAAFSWFDLGRRSVQSVVGVYEPAHARYGLGFYTLLLEIQYALERGLHYHYAGYVLGEASSMDYKRRVGQLDYLDPCTLRWSPEFPFELAHSPAEVQRHRLHEVHTLLCQRGLPADLVTNSAFYVPQAFERFPSCAPDPLLLICRSTKGRAGLQVSWDDRRQSYLLSAGQVLWSDPEPEDDGSLTPPVCLFFKQRLLLQCQAAAPVVDEVHKLARKLS